MGAEETIPEGLESGDCDECILDGYSVTFSRYIVTTGFVAMSQVNMDNPQESSVVGVADRAASTVGTTSALGRRHDVDAAHGGGLSAALKQWAHGDFEIVLVCLAVVLVLWHGLLKPDAPAARLAAVDR